MQMPAETTVIISLEARVRGGYWLPDVGAWTKTRILCRRNILS